MSEAMLTTVDNPYDPFTEFEQWFDYDERRGYHTCSFLARLAFTSDNLTDKENERAIEAAIDEIVQENVLGIYKKVVKPT